MNPAKGLHQDVAVFDVASMCPCIMLALNKSPERVHRAAAEALRRLALAEDADRARDLGRQERAASRPVHG